MNAPDPVTIVTGASSGIGLELARVFARNGHKLVLIARRGDRLANLSDELVRAGCPQPVVLSMDLQPPGMADKVDAELKARGLEPNYVVNNAGFGLVGRASDCNRAEQLEMIDLNARTLTDFSLKWIDALERHKGGILQIASVAGYLPGPNSAVYYASKAYVLSFSEALYFELKEKGIRVTALCPGPVPTEFQARAGLPRTQVNGVLDVPAARVAEEAYRGLMSGQRVVVPGLLNKLVAVIVRFVPKFWLLPAVDIRQKRRM